MILPQTNNTLPAGEQHVQYGEFLCWLRLWMLMGTLVDPGGMSSGLHTPLMPFMEPLFIWASG